MDEKSVPQAMLVIRKPCRWFASFWILIAAIILAKGIVDVVNDPDSAESWFSVIGAIGISVPAYLFWKIPDWLISRYQAQIAQAMQDPSKVIQRKQAETSQTIIEHIEIIDKSSKEKFVKEDQYGRVIFDSTQRPMRLIFSSVFLIIGLIIGGLMFSFSSDIGFFEYFFVGGWILFCLINMGFVYEVIIDKTRGIAERKAGWFIFVFRRRVYLMDFSRVAVESTFYRHRYDRMRERYRSEDPKFSVNLSGTKELNVRVFKHLTDARNMGEELSEYLELPVEEKTDIRI